LAILVPLGRLVGVVVIIELHVWGIFISTATTTVTTSAGHNTWGSGLARAWRRRDRVVVWWVRIGSTATAAAATVVTAIMRR
jgi:hypothetical protein